LRGWLAILDQDERTAEEIACQRLPLAPLPAPSRVLGKGDEPISLNGTIVGQKVGIGRAGALDNADPAQNNAPAARLVQSDKGPMSK
jgi:hypothetical protein